LEKEKGKFARRGIHIKEKKDPKGKIRRACTVSVFKGRWKYVLSRGKSGLRR